MKRIDQKRLREVLYYHRETGQFVWLIQRRFIGRIAGTLHPNGYIRISVDGDLYYAHRLAWLYVYGRWPEPQTDHINHVRHDNRIENLRECTSAENKRNHSRTLRPNGLPTGVRRERYGRYSAYLSLSGKRYFLGVRDTTEQAECLYKKKRRELFGEFCPCK